MESKHPSSLSAGADELAGPGMIGDARVCISYIRASPQVRFMDMLNPVAAQAVHFFDVVSPCKLRVPMPKDENVVLAADMQAK